MVITSDRLDQRVEESSRPPRDWYVNALREAMATAWLMECGVYFGTTGGQVYASADVSSLFAQPGKKPTPVFPWFSRRKKGRAPPLPDRTSLKPRSGPRRIIFCSKGLPGSSRANSDALPEPGKLVGLAAR
jgi:hypothetical protein